MRFGILNSVFSVLNWDKMEVVGRGGGDVYSCEGLGLYSVLLVWL